MCINLYKDFDDIISERNHMLKYAEDNYLLLSSNVQQNTAIVKYGKDSMYLGHFCPSLVLDKVTRGFKKERLMKSIPKNRNKYVIYEIDCDRKLLRIQSINSFGAIFETYVIRKEDIEYGVTMQNKKACSVVSNTRSTINNDRLVRFDIISSSNIWSEFYSYDSRNKIRCKQYHYVPNLNGSSKAIPIGESGSPMKLFEMEIETDELNNITEIRHGEFISGYTELECIYSK